MIYTITFNPAIDLVINVEHATLGELHRLDSEHYVIGGKGINMSMLLQALHIPNTAVTFLGGFTGDYIQSELEKKGIKVKAIAIDGTTRINVKLKSDTETEFNANGPSVSPAQFQELFAYFQECLTAEDTVLLAGNKAVGMTAQHYIAIAQLCQEKGAKFVLDTTKDLLTKCLPYQPFLIKPNHHELAEIFNAVIDTQEDIITYAKCLQEKGAKNVLVSRGGNGSLLLTEDGCVYTANIPKGTLVNSVGAGDSMVAGFMAQYLVTNDYKKALQQGAACGSATAFSIGIADEALIHSLMPHIHVTQYH